MHIREYKYNIKNNIPFKTSMFSKDWRCIEKWSYNFFKSFNKLEVKYNSVVTGNKLGKLTPPYTGTMLFTKFISILEKNKPSDLRLFSFNLLNYKKELKKDFITDKNWIENFYLPNPWLLFGAKGSVSRLHYDVDFCPNFLTHLKGTKTVWLFSPEDSKYLYKFPFAVHSPVDVKNPDYKAYPQFKNAKARKFTLQKGDTLYIPPGWWHYIEYTTSGYSLSIRSFPKSIIDFFRGCLTIFFVYMIDSFFHYTIPNLWHNYKIKNLNK